MSASSYGYWESDRPAIEVGVTRTGLGAYRRGFGLRRRVGTAIAYWFTITCVSVLLGTGVQVLELQVAGNVLGSEVLTVGLVAAVAAGVAVLARTSWRRLPAEMAEALASAPWQAWPCWPYPYPHPEQDERVETSTRIDLVDLDRNRVRAFAHQFPDGARSVRQDRPFTVWVCEGTNGVVVLGLDRGAVLWRAQAAPDWPHGSWTQSGYDADPAGKRAFEQAWPKAFTAARPEANDT